MISTQRLAMIVLAINFVIGLSGGLYYNIDTYSDEVIKDQITFLETQENQFSDDGILYSGVKNKETLTDPSIGSSLNWGKIILDIFIYGINPYSIKSELFESQLEQHIADGLTIFRIFLWVVLAIQTILVIKNKMGN